MRTREEIKEVTGKPLAFSFEDLVTLDDYEPQLLLKSISAEDVILALKGASDPVREGVFRSMPDRASKRLREDLEAMDSSG